MRTSRISQDTSRALNATTSRSTRLTRSALAQFSLNAGPATVPSVREGGDIEDAITDGSVGKRKRGTAVAARGGLKKDEDGDDKAAWEGKREEASDSELSSAPSSPASPPPARNARRQPVKRIKRSPPPPASGSGAAAGPENWERIYDLVMKMRTEGGVAADAAVDTMGCHTLAQADASPRDRRFQTLVSLMMSSQTKDTTNYVVMQKLYKELPAATPGGKPGLNLENILAVPAERLNELIWAVGFHNNKTRYIKGAAEILRDAHGGDIPDTAEGLMALPGVGPKMAYLCLSAAWGRVEGIGVDVHVHRITNLWGWHGRGGTKGPEETRGRLEGWVPRGKWAEINWLLVGFGQTVCMSEKGRRRCGECEVGLEGLCGAADGVKVRVGRERRKREREVMKVEFEGKEEGKGGEMKEGEVVKTNGIKDEVVKEEVLESVEKKEEETETNGIKEEVVNGVQIKGQDDGPEEKVIKEESKD
ncbi:alpha,alpha-trehalase nth1 [Pseudogymnoascus australis]